jgi:hypothetical protein
MTNLLSSIVFDYAQLLIVLGSVVLILGLLGLALFLSSDVGSSGDQVSEWLFCEGEKQNRIHPSERESASGKSGDARLFE